MMKQSSIDKIAAIWQQMTGSKYREAAFQPDTSPGFRTCSTEYECKSYSPKDNIYSMEDFGYLFNSEGFRCDELVPSETDDLRIVFTGCSFTFGTGLPVEHTFAHRVVTRLREEEGMNVQHWNVGHGGTSIEYSVRALYQFTPRLKPDLIVALFPNHTRREAFVPHRASRNPSLINYLPNWFHANFDVRGLEDFYFDENIFFNVANSYAFFDTIARAHKAEYLWHNWSYLGFMPEDAEKLIPQRMKERMLDLPRVDVLGEPPKARDLAHWGPNAHQSIADAIYKQMGNAIETGRARKAARLKKR